MARIRSVKPEFWKSVAIARLPHRTRLAFIALWSYVDDNGVGRDVPQLIHGELFALEPDPREALANVREDLARLSDEGRITRYTVGGKPYLHITNWDEHQRIDKPNKPRYPGPDDPGASVTCGYGGSREDPATPSRDPRDSPEQTQRLEQGSRGAGEQGIPPEAGARADVAVAVIADTTTAQILVAEWLDHCRKRPPGSVVGQVGKLIRQMLEEGIDSSDVRSGLAAWATKGTHPATLPSVVHEVMNGSTNVRPFRGNARVDAGDAILAEAFQRGAQHQPELGA